MATRSADARWEGTLQEGKGTVKLGSGAFEGNYSFASRFEEGTGTNPEELIAAAEAGCFTMALGAALGRAGHSVDYIQTNAKVHMRRDESGVKINKIELFTEGRVQGIDQATFQQQAEDAKKNCIISRALGGVEEMTVQATLLS